MTEDVLSLLGPEEMLGQLQARGDATSLQAIYDGLVDLGYVPSTATVKKPGNKQRRYISWRDPARPGEYVIRFEARDLWFVMGEREDLKRAASVPGILTYDGRSKHNVHFKITGQTVPVILDAARRVKRSPE